MSNEWIYGAAMFGQIERPAAGQPIGKLPGLLMGDIVLIVLTGLALLGLFMYWAKYLRNRKTTKKEPLARRVYHESDPPESEGEAEDEVPESRRKYKYRWKRRTHRSRKPTLAETGGLPPSRQDEEAESP